MWGKNLGGGFSKGGRRRSPTQTPLLRAGAHVFYTTSFGSLSYFVVLHLMYTLLRSAKCPENHNIVGHVILMTLRLLIQDKQFLGTHKGVYCGRAQKISVI